MASEVTMFKLLLFAAVAANGILLVVADGCNKCKKNEEYSDCINGGCVPRNCSQLGNPVPCPKIDKCACIKGCVCKEGYLRADNGTCINIKNCPSCGGDPNAESGCGVFCITCSNYNSKSNIACPEICKLNGCECKAGFIYDDKIKKCVRPKDCTPKCKKNEEYSDCVNGGCDARNCTQLGLPVPCVKIDPKDCIKGCICQEGYLRAKNGTCIPKNECPSCGGDPNATSGCGVFCKQCRGNVPCPRICKPNSCDCKPGFVYDSNIQKCVMPCDCTPTCKINEVYSDCTNGGCDAKNCSQLGKPVPCVKIDPKYCIKGCVCDNGYLRADNGTCIPKEECSSCDGDPNATSGCGVFCLRCRGPVPCPKICKVNSCDCKKGYVYDDNTKKCTKPEDCTPTCKENEIYSNCSNTSGSATNCSQLGTPIPAKGPEPCKEGCICKPDYLRADNGTCIPTLECPSCGGDPNAESGCGVFCTRCSNYKLGPIGCPAICQLNGCECRKGYIYDDITKKCVKPEDCTPVCKENEEYTECIKSGCNPTNCSELGTPLQCGPEPCEKGCVCKQGYIKADNGTCIPINECPSCGGDPNAESGCGTFCTRCSNYKSGPIPCPASCRLNGCECRKGYIYDDVTKKCVQPKDCTPICKENEVLNGCINGRCGHTYCKDLGGPILCVDPPPGGCIKGCLCAKGYLRAENGTCIPENECPCGGDPNAQPGCSVYCKRCSNYKNDTLTCPLRPCLVGGCECREGYIYDDAIGRCVLPENCSKQCPVNEVYSECSNSNCDARNCAEVGKPVPCVDVASGDCIGGCVCESGYVRADNGTCIPKTSCPSCNDDPNAVPGCGTFCTRCDNYKKGPVACIAICHINGCDCKKGYIYDQNIKKCVLPDDCSPTCKENEVFSNCTNGGCDAKNCSQLGKPVPCVDPIDGACEKGCICGSGYLRADNGTCIPITECPSCNDDPNAGAGCGTFCRRCDNIEMEVPLPCPHYCIPNGCDCKKGFIYDRNIKKCVRPDDCSPTCKVNEVFSNCTNGGCLPQNCSQLGKPVPCVKLSPDACKKGCVCTPGYLRADNGTCVPDSECPSCNDDPNAERGCGSFCDRCSNYNQKHSCPIGCILNGCQCRKGFIYDQNIKKCVLPEQCRNCTTGHEYFSCGVACDNVCATLSQQNQTHCPILTRTCVRQCYCEKGYARDSKGICIPIKNCPAPTCKENEEFSTCANGICRLQNCTQYGAPIPFCPKFDTTKCKPGCVCKLKFLKNKEGQCIPQDDCPEAQCQTTTTTTTTTEKPCSEDVNDD